VDANFFKPEKAMSDNLKRVLDQLLEMASQADEDCPAEYRSRSFRDALDDSFALLREFTIQRVLEEKANE